MAGPIVLTPLTDPAQLPHLLRLLDDDSVLTRTAVTEALAGWGDSLPSALAAVPSPPGLAARRLMQDLLLPASRARLRERWRGLDEVGSDLARLEAGLGWIADFQTWLVTPGALGPHLDRLAEGARNADKGFDSASLASYLFHDLAMRGAEEDYDDPLNSNAIHAITAGRGLPITLACVYILTGERLGLDIRGVGSPGHFLALIRVEGEPVLVDAFHGGRLLPRDHVNGLNPDLPDAFGALLALEVGASAILSRVLANLQRAYTAAQRLEDAALMDELRRRTVTIP